MWFFNYSDFIRKSKFVSTLIDDNYVVTYSKDDSSFHYDLQQIIFDKFGDFYFSIIAYDNDLLIWKEESDEFSDDGIDVIIGIIDEVEKYIYNTGIVKDINISCNHINLCSYRNNLNSYNELKIKNEKTKLVTKWLIFNCF